MWKWRLMALIAGLLGGVPIWIGQGLTSTLGILALALALALVAVFVVVTVTDWRKKKQASNQEPG